MFRIGEKVVCIKRDAWSSTYNEIPPVFGGTYTIRDLTSSQKWPGETVCRLVEIRNEPRDYLGGVTECWFRASHFRPIVERKTDISIFTAMLTDKREPAHA